MQRPRQKSRPESTPKNRPASLRERKERKEQLLTRRSPSVARSIADAVVVKDEDLYFLTERDGSVPLGDSHGFGLYYHDCRFLDGYELRLAGAEMNPLAATASRGYTAVLELTNPDFQTPDGRLIEKESIGMTWKRTIDSRRRMLDDLITVRNYAPKEIDFPLSITFQAGFEDVFAVRGLLPERPGRLHPPVWKKEILQFAYDGGDGLYRSVVIRFSPSPWKKEETTAAFRMRLGSEEEQEILVSVAVIASSRKSDLTPKRFYSIDTGAVERALNRSSEAWLENQTKIRSDGHLLNEVLERSLRDLGVLRTTIIDRRFFAAGVPWFTTLFGRDSLISALQTLAFQQETAEQTLRLLAHYQGRKEDPWRDERPGKILHEFRMGELARMGEIPYTPYYGTVDATPLFLILIGRHAAWSGSMALFHDLKEHIERALEWIASEEARNGGYIAYESDTKQELINQGWKDSGDAIVNEEGEIARPPIALVEVQGYVYLAKRLIADLYRRAGEADRADRLLREADDLRTRFNRDFWLEERGHYALALQAGKKPAAVLSSNPGHALWARIADPEKAQKTMARLTADDMFSGWGVRTLSEKERRYNPIGYHLGTVWPHDNSFIAAGFRRYGHDEAALRIFTGIIEAAMHFSANRLPELFSGFSRKTFDLPVHYPVACHPQAWAAGSVPYFIESFLGLAPEAFERRLRIVRPILPGFIDHLEVHSLRVGEARVDLKFDRIDGDRIKTSVIKVEGEIDVRIEEEGDSISS